MKKIITYLSILTIGLIATSNSAEARTYSRGYHTTYISGYLHCGTPIYTKKIFSHYNNIGKAIFTYSRITPKKHSYSSPRKVSYSTSRRSVKHNSYSNNKRHSSRSYSRRY